MAIDLCIEIIEKQVTIKVLEKNFCKTFTDLTILNRNGLITSVGEFESHLDFRKNLRELIKKTTDEDIKKFSNKKVDQEKYKKIRSMCIEDIENDTYTFWEEEKKNYQFIYPYRVESFDPQLASSVLLYYATVCKHNIKYKFYERFNYYIQLNHYNTIDNNERSLFEREIKKRLPRGKHILINDYEI